VETSIRYNIYDKLIILIIAAHVFGHILSPFTAGRIIAIFIAPFLFIRSNIFMGVVFRRCLLSIVFL